MKSFLEHMKTVIREAEGGHRIITTYQTVSPESAEAGDFEDSGFITGGNNKTDDSDEGESMEVDKDFDDEDATVVSKTIAFLKDKGATNPSSSHFGGNIWYSDGGDTDYQTGEEETRSYHLEGYTEAEEKEIFEAMTKRRQ